MSTSSSSLRFASFSSILSLALLGACGSSGASGPTGGPVVDGGDNHCGSPGAMTVRKVGLCAPDNDDAAVPAGDGGDDGGAPAVEEYGPPLYNTEGYDDDCKYHVSFTATPVRLNDNVTFTLTIVGLDPAGPSTHADVYAEVTLGDSHVAPKSGNTTEKGNGVYELGPVVFDRSGRWVVRFHMYGTCSDLPADSPHGHIAFYIDVP